MIIICGIVEATAIDFSLLFNEFVRPYYSPSVEFLDLCATLFDFTSHYGPLLVEIYLTWLLCVYLRMIIDGYLSPTKRVQPSQLANKWMTVTLRNRNGMVSAIIGNPNCSTGV